ncbi:MAG: YaeP family protein, partial [Enterovibrio sp.]
MKVFECCELVRQFYAEIGGGEQGFVPQAINCAIATLDTIADDQSIPLALRKQAAFAAANLLISDHQD